MVDTEHSTLTGADLHDPKAHDSSHESGGSDEVMINDLNINGTIDVDGNNIYGASDIRAEVGHTIEIQTEDTTRAQMLSDSNVYFYRDVRAQPTATYDLGTEYYKWKDIWGVTMHGQLADDQTQFLLTNGSRDVAGDLVPDGNNTRHLGTMSRYWNDICVTTVRATTLHGTLNTAVGINKGGSGQTTQQAAIDALTAVAAGTNEYVLTKDTGTGNAIWKVAVGGGGDMLKATYDPNDDGVIAVAQTEATKYPDAGEQAFLDADHTKLNGIETAADVTDSTNVSAAGALMKSGGTMTADLNMGAFDLTHVDRIMSDSGEELGLHSKNGTVALSIENSIIYSSRDIYPITTGTKNLGGPANHWNIITADNLKGDLAATYITGTLAVANGGTGVTGDTYDAKYVDGCSPGTTDGDVYKIASATTGSVLWHNSTTIDYLTPGTNGYQLTTQGAGNPVVWAAASDLIWSDTHCPKCGKEFKDGEELALQIRKHNEVGDILTVPVHIKCTDAYKVLEDRISELEDK